METIVDDVRGILARVEKIKLEERSDQRLDRIKTDVAEKLQALTDRIEAMPPIQQYAWQTAVCLEMLFLIAQCHTALDVASGQCDTANLVVFQRINDHIVSNT